MRRIIQVVLTHDLKIADLGDLITSWRDAGLSITVVNENLEIVKIDQPLRTLEHIAIDLQNYHALSIIGDHTVLDTSVESLNLIEAIQNFDEKHFPIAGISTGLIPLARAGVLVGKWASKTEYSSLTRYLNAYGALISEEPVVQSGWIISASSCAHLDKYIQAVASAIENRIGR
jgi:putative intracellular protease/amidase